MYRLIYVSTASPSLRQGDIGAILDVSQSNNYERFLTGFLAHNGQSFMQALEGDAAEVREVFARIKTDPRHHGVVQIAGETIQSRAFPEWSMNYFRVDSRAAMASMVARRDDPVDSLLPSEMPADILKLFSRFLGVR